MAQKLTAKAEPDALLRIEYIPLDKIARFDKNPKKHDVGALVASIRRYGFRDAPIFDGTLKALVAGHGRLKALEAMKGEGDKPPAGIIEHSAGQWLVPVQMGVDSKSAAEAKAFLIDHNTLTLSGGDLGVDSMLRLYDQGGLEELLRESGPTVSFDGEDIDELINGKKEVAEDDPSALIDAAKELEKKWGTKLGQLWILGEHRVLCGDSTKAEDVGRSMRGDKADCVFTSPPYGVGIDYGSTYTDNIANLREMLPKLAARWAEIVTPGGFAVINFGDIISGRIAAESDVVCEYPMAVEYWPVFRAAGFVLWSRRIWCKPVARVAAPWCASSNRSATNYEHVWTWKVDGDPIIGRVPGPMDSQTGWFDTSRLEGVDVGKETHGAGMPVSTAAWMLNVHSRRGNAVHEPFLGTGTTLIAADQLGRKCYGLEISPQYVAVILERWSKATGKEPRLES